jgi:hypothetical protein
MVNSKCKDKRESFALEIAKFLSNDIQILNEGEEIASGVVVINDSELSNSLVDKIVKDINRKYIIVAPNKTYVCYDLIRETSLRYSLDI